MSFDQAVEETLKHEGGYVNHPLDRGGPTNYGITMGTLSMYRGGVVSVTDVQNLTRDEAKAVYKKLYWDNVGLDKLKSARVAGIVFDLAVNFGQGQAVMLLQRAARVTEDGKLGPVTATVVNNFNEKTLALEIVFNAQLRYARLVKNNPSQAVFIEGWISRTHSLLRRAIA